MLHAGTFCLYTEMSQRTYVLFIVYSNKNSDIKQTVYHVYHKSKYVHQHFQHFLLISWYVNGNCSTSVVEGAQNKYNTTCTNYYGEVQIKLASSQYSSTKYI